ncbi:MAG: hypothetical protein VYE22_03650 [Myxococcota bacterium]|nr:hypothetical protein [Myxococcota bacterium]
MIPERVNMRESTSAGGLVASAVAEAVGAFAAPRVRAKVLELALRWARRGDIPEWGPDVRDFVEGPLLRATEELLGADLASAISDELAPMVRMLDDAESSGVRKSVPAPPALPDFERAPAPLPDRPRATGHRLMATDPAPSSLPIVLIASGDPGAVEALSLALAGHATVEPVRDALAILENLGGDDAAVVVMDCRRPVVRVETLLALSPELPPDSRVVLWGEPRNLDDSLRMLGVGLPPSWVRCGREARQDDVAAVCRVIST